MDLGFARVCSTIVNVASTLFAEKGKTPKPVSLIDYMPEWDPKEKVTKKKGQTVQQMKNFLLGIVKRKK